jgi:hypothetical protein
MNDVIKLSGLWKSEKPTRDGKPFYKGTVREQVTIEPGSVICLFKNESENPNAPMFSLTVMPPREQQAPADRHYSDSEEAF